MALLDAGQAWQVIFRCIIAFFFFSRGIRVCVTARSGQLTQALLADGGEHRFSSSSVAPRFYLAFTSSASLRPPRCIDSICQRGTRVCSCLQSILNTQGIAMSLPEGLGGTAGWGELAPHRADAPLSI